MRRIAAIATIAACQKAPDPRIEDLSPSPVHAVEIQVEVGSKGCTITHPNGAHERELHIPADTPTRLVMTSRDEAHGIAFGDPPLRAHVERGHYTHGTFRIHDPATLPFECPDGVESLLIAMPLNDYETYLVKLRESGDPHAGWEQQIR